MSKNLQPVTSTPLARLRFRDRWADHAEAIASGDTPREMADRRGIHRNTAHRWRRCFLAVPAEGRPERLSGIAEADETFYLRSAKGQPRVRAAQGRLPRKRGGKAVKRGRSREQVCVLVARDRAGHTVQDVCAQFDAAEAVPVLRPVLSRDVILRTDGHSVYQAVAKARGIKHKPLSQSAGIPSPGRVPHPERRWLSQPAETMDDPLQRGRDNLAPALLGMVSHVGPWARPGPSQVVAALGRGIAIGSRRSLRFLRLHCPLGRS
jgi:hypothetical protein